ncbi:hypothetical protein [Psychrosphaera haliotis]|uniref:Phytanoyl-CoA dioxygenase n=1 Tax=Psychrosphaera haliotis TaxID=555083 RepID=A0A6N8F7G7_9GAMM|nr:hypothetical protein [Psychrosphaera haliotis]MUH71349.1 hypothetical protein [Psychrosphaera haliotis]
MNKLKNNFSKDGFKIVKGVLSSSEIDEIREVVGAQEPGTRLMQPPKLNKLPHVLNVFVNKRVDSHLQEILGDFYRFSSHQLQINSFTQATLQKASSGAHIDGIKELELNLSYMSESIPAWVNIGIYLQDYDNDGFGGGIAVLENSHKVVRLLARLPCSSVFIKSFIKVTKFLPFKYFKEVKTEPGDAIIFDNRLIHTSIPTKSTLKNENASHQQFVSSIPNKNRKLAFYWFAGKTELNAEILSNNFYSRVNRAADKTKTGGFDYKLACELDNEFKGDIRKMLGAK